MENEINQPPTSAQAPSGDKPKVYDPGNYTLVGLFLTLIPVFIMSLHNGKILPNGEEIRKRIKIYMWVYILLIVGNLLLIFWAAYTGSKAILESPDAISLVLKPDSALENIGGVKLARTILEAGNAILFIIHFILLILTLRFTNKNEKPQFIELRRVEQIDRKSALIPSLIGLALSLALFFYAIPAMVYLTKLFI